jgi:hypothetical protein
MPRQAARVDDIILMQYFGQRVLAAPEVSCCRTGPRFEVSLEDVEYS